MGSDNGFTGEHSSHATSIVRLDGEIDLARAPEVSATLAEAASDDTSVVVADMSSVSFLDSSGLGLLVKFRETLQGRVRPVALRLVIREPQVLRVFSLTGLDGVFDIYETVEEATGPSR